MNGENVIREWNKMSCPKAALIVRTDSDRWEQIDNLFQYNKFCDVKECFLFTEKAGIWNMLYFDEKSQSELDYFGADEFRMEVIDNHLLSYFGDEKIGDYPLSFENLENSFLEIKDEYNNRKIMQAQK